MDGRRCGRAGTRSATGSRDGAAGDGAAALVASTLPELLQDDSAAAFLERGVPPVAGLRTALACAAALRPAGRATRRGCARSPCGRAPVAPGDWLAEAEAKALLRGGGRRGPRRPRRRRRGRRGGGRARARRTGRAQGLLPRAAAQERGGRGGAGRRSATTRCAPRMRACSAAGGGAPVLVEAMAAPGVELVSRRDATRSCRRWSSGSAASGPSCSATWRSCRCRRRPRASRRRCGRCAAPGC